MLRVTSLDPPTEHLTIASEAAWSAPVLSRESRWVVAVGVRAAVDGRHHLLPLFSLTVSRDNKLGIYCRADILHANLYEGRSGSPQSRSLFSLNLSSNVYKY